MAERPSGAFSPAPSKRLGPPRTRIVYSCLSAILSAEIIVIALGTVQDAELAVRIGVVSVIAAAMTVGVYGLVAGCKSRKRRSEDRRFFLL